MIRTSNPHPHHSLVLQRMRILRSRMCVPRPPVEDPNDGFSLDSPSGMPFPFLARVNTRSMPAKFFRLCIFCFVFNVLLSLVVLLRILYCG
jgi:hypothetical protein